MEIEYPCVEVKRRPRGRGGLDINLMLTSGTHKIDHGLASLTETIGLARALARDLKIPVRLPKKGGG